MRQTRAGGAGPSGAGATPRTPRARFDIPEDSGAGDGHGESEEEEEGDEPAPTEEKEKPKPKSTVKGARRTILPYDDPGLDAFDVSSPHCWRYAARGGAGRL